MSDEIVRAKYVRGIGYEIKIDEKVLDNREVYEWCVEQFGDETLNVHAPMRWMYDFGGKFYFLVEEDAVFFRLAWG